MIEMPQGAMYTRPRLEPFEIKGHLILGILLHLGRSPHLLELGYVAISCLLDELAAILFARLLSYLRCGLVAGVHKLL